MRTLKPEDRKAAVAAYKERKATAAVYLIGCAPAGRRWVGSAPNLATVWNRLSFTLRQGDNPNRSLQTVWRDHGGASFSFEIVERVDEEELVYGRDRVLKERADHWRQTLGAERI